MKEGPPATIWGGRWLSGQFSILMIESLLQRASSKGRLCRLGLSFKYSSSRFSSVPVKKKKSLIKFLKTLVTTKKFNAILGIIYWIHISSYFLLLILKLSTTADLTLCFVFKSTGENLKTLMSRSYSIPIQSEISSFRVGFQACRGFFENTHAVSPEILWGTTWHMYFFLTPEVNLWYSQCL